jgi:ABC-2 type transport system permease protein
MSNNTLQWIDDRGWAAGLRNFLRKENGLWWGTRRWWVQSLVWFLAVNGLVVLILWVFPALEDQGGPPDASVVEVFMQMLGAIGTFGVLIFMQGSIVNEKQSGTAAWIMTNPVSRSAFVLSKLIANSIGILLIVVVLQGLLGYAQFAAHDEITLKSADFILALILQSLHFMFYITLTLMLGAFFNSRGPVMGISIAVLALQDLGGQLLALAIPWVPEVLPKRLVDMAGPVALGRMTPAMPPILTTVLFSILFLGIAIWRFHREEF